MFRLPKTEVPASPATHGPQKPTGACLVRIYPAGVGGSLIAIDRPAIRLGRGQHCEYELPDEYASREHCVIELVNGQHIIRDLRSMNGTFVNDQQIDQPQILKPGDQLRVGYHIFKYLSENHVEAMYHEAVFQMMTIDALTQTYNKRYFEDAFQREVLRSTRHGRSLGLLMIDVDHFKDVNDKYGHLVGDELLVGLCRRMKLRVRGDEILARVGGEEFAIGAVEIPQDKLYTLANEIRDLVAAKPFETAKGSIPLTISIGAAHSTGVEIYSPKELIERADQKLYDAKASGRNCIRY